jgi:hypothetical protein
MTTLGKQGPTNLGGWVLAPTRPTMVDASIHPTVKRTPTTPRERTPTTPREQTPTTPREQAPTKPPGGC